MTSKYAVRSTNKYGEQTSAETVRMRWLIGVAAALALLCLVVWWPSWRTYPTVTSRESLGMLKLLYTACNTKDPVRLEKVERSVGQFAQEGKLSTVELTAFGKIIATAKGGDWEQAEKASFKFAQDQLGQGSDTLAPNCCEEEKKPANKKVVVRK